MAGTPEGALKTAAVRVGVTVEEYQRRRDAGQKWCYVHQTWHMLEDFPRDRSRGDGRKAKCLAADRGQPRAIRDPLHEQARYAVNLAVRYGRLPRANTVPCTDCGHIGPGKRHEYDHHRGYQPEHHLDVEPVCTTCHADRERARRG